MATLTVDVSGQSLVVIPLSANISALTLTGALDGQMVTLEFQQNSTGGYTVASAQIPGLVNPASGANAVSSQSFRYTALNNTWAPVPTPGGAAATYTAAGAIAIQSGLILIGGASAQAYTLAAPASGPQSGTGQDGVEMKFSVTSAHAHTITTPANGIGGAYDTITFAAVGDACTLRASGGVWYRVAGAGTNTLSEV
jgi:hypothetical protein